MNRYLHFTVGAGVVALLSAGPLFAQSKAKAENVPVIPHTSVPNFFKLPPNLYFGEGIGIATNSKGHVFVYTRSGDTRLFEFDQTGAFVREIGQGLYGLEFAHAVRVDAQDNVWVVDEGTNMVIKFNSRRACRDGAGPAAGAGHGTVRQHAPRGAAREVQVRPAHRCDMGRAGQHLRLRRLRQLARREVRQERPLPQVVRRRPGIVAKPVEYPAFDHLRRPGQHLCRRSRQRARAGAGQRPRPESHLRQRRQSLGGVRFAGTPSVPVRLELEPGQPTRRHRGPSPAKSTRWSWTARSSGSSGRPARGWENSARFTRSTAGIRTSCSCRKSRPGAPRRSC